MLESEVPMKQESAHAFSIKKLLLAIASCLSLVPPASNFGLFWFAVFAFALSVISDARRAIDHLVLFTAMAFGFLPFFGWFSLPAWCNPLSILVVVYLYSALSDFKTPKFSGLGNALSISPAVIAGILTFRWWCGFSKGTPEAVLERLLPIWDLSAHFSFFVSNLTTGVYIPRISKVGDGTHWFGAEYPSGLHYLFSLFARENKNKVIENPQDALPIFANSIVVSLAFAAFIAAICGWRLAKTRLLQFAFSAMSAGLSCALITLGPISQTISTGFANMPAVLIPLFILVSIHLRPLEDSNQQLAILTACISTIGFNWYPISILVAPLLVIQLKRIANEGKKLGVIVASIALLILVVPPIVQTLSLGVAHLDLSGGIQPFPPGLLVAILLISFSVAIISLFGARTTLIYSTANAVPFPFTVLFAIWLHSRSQSYNYYFHKSMLFVAVFAAMTILYSTLRWCAELQTNTQFQNFKRGAPVIIGSVVLGLGLSQTFGYWGPTYPSLSGLSTAYGVLQRNEITKRAQIHLENSKAILQLVNETREFDITQRECVLVVVPLETKTNAASTYAPAITTLTNIWYHALSGSYTNTVQERSVALSGLLSYTDETVIAESLSAIFDPATVCLYSSLGVTRALDEEMGQWNLNQL
jgi:hypothetical protein